jgi:hypothetical protein
MKTMFRCAIAAIAALAFTLPAAAQGVRAFPQNALRGAMVFGDYPNIQLNGRATTLTPGSRVRNQNGMIVLAATLTGSKLLVHYTLEIGEAQVRDVWILRPEEAAVRPWPTTLEEARTWIYDPAEMTWVKP